MHNVQRRDLRRRMVVSLLVLPVVSVACAQGGDSGAGNGVDASSQGEASAQADAAGADVTTDRASNADVTQPAPEAGGDDATGSDGVSPGDASLGYDASSADGGAEASSDDGGADGTTQPEAASEAGMDAGASGADAAVDARVDAPADVAAEAPPPVCSPACPAQSVCVGGSCTPARRVFVSSAVFQGNLGGHAGADAKCLALANGASLGGTWMAWVSDTSSNPKARFTQPPATVGYRLVDGSPVAANWAALTGGTLAHAINLDETGKPFVQPSEVWTATGTSGALYADGCTSFTSNVHTAPTAEEGHCDAVDAMWTNAYLQFCERNAHLYCFEQ